LTPFLGFVYLCLTQDPYFQMGQQKNWPSALHQIFRVCRGHKVGHNDTVLREFDEGILRRKKNFGPPHISPFGGQGALKFFCMTEAYRPHILTKYWATEFKREYGGRCQKYFATFGGRRRGRADLGPPR